MVRAESLVALGSLHRRPPRPVAPAGAGLKAAYARLVVNDEETVLATLAHVLAAADSPAAAVGVDHREVTLVVVVPDPSVLPEEYPVTGIGGRVAVRPVSGALAASWYRQLVAGHAVLAARQAFAACPGIDVGVLVVLRRRPGDEGAEVLLATRLARSRLDRLHWAAVTAWDVVETVGDHTLCAVAGEVRALAPLDLADQPELADLVGVVRF